MPHETPPLETPSGRGRPKIVVVGSLNVDHTLRVPHFPAPGETLAARGAFTCFGGKGANQALAAARAGGEVTLIGCVGDDDFGCRYIEYLRAEGIDTGGIVQVSAPTGSAFITVDDAGENSIVYDPGANHALQPHHLDALAAVVRAAAALLLQLECPWPTVLRAIELARAGGVPVILNPSPLTPEFVQSRPQCDTLIVNEHEAVALVTMTLAEIRADPQRGSAMARCRELVITRGGESTLLITDGPILEIAPPKVTPVDTVGAGDTFAGAFVGARAGGAPLAEAVRFANAAGALATQTLGAQTSVPKREDILRFMATSVAS